MDSRKGRADEILIFCLVRKHCRRDADATVESVAGEGRLCHKMEIGIPRCARNDKQPRQKKSPALVNGALNSASVAGSDTREPPQFSTFPCRRRVRPALEIPSSPRGCRTRELRW